MNWGAVTNGVVLVVSLAMSCVCVAVKICFMVQLFLLERSRRRYFEEHIESLQVNYVYYITTMEALWGESEQE